MTDKAARWKISRAMTDLICDDPFYALIAGRLNFVEREPEWFYAQGVPFATMATDGREIAYSVDYVDSLTHRQLQGTICHEVLHVAYLHHLRMGNRELLPWNIAGDHAINYHIEQDGKELAPGTLKGIKDCAENIYEDMDPQEFGKSGGDGNDCRAGYVMPQGKGDGEKLSESELEQAIDEAKIMIQQAANAAKSAGKLPAHIEELVKDLVDSKLPWREILARWLDGFNRNDYSWQRANRRYCGGDFIVPALYQPDVAKIVMACDTSGSISQQELIEACSEVMALQAQYESSGKDPELTVLWWDVAVYPQTIYHPDEMKPQGRGGTSFEAAARWLNEHDEIKACVAVTDGYIYRYGDKPHCDLLWILTRRRDDFDPPFGEIAGWLNE